MKTCTRCGFPKPIEEFVKSTQTSSGRGAHCLVCDRDRVAGRRQDPSVRIQCRIYSAGYRASNLEVLRSQDRQIKRDQQVWLNTLKGKPCVDCCSAFPPCCMDFDHVVGTKTKGIGQLLGCSKEIVLSEMAKCELVCACCHRVRTRIQVPESGDPRRREFYYKVSLLKQDSCMDCGFKFPPVAMDFDHVRGIKVATISQMRLFSWSRVLLELAKCDLVCANCHRIRTSNRVVRVAA